MILEYLKCLVNTYKKNGYENYLIFFNDVKDDDFNIKKSNISCYFAKSPILQNSDYSFTVEEECVFVDLNLNDLAIESIRRQDTSLILNEFEDVIVSNNSYIFTNAIINSSAGISVNMYPSFVFEDFKTNTNLTFTNFMLVLIFVTFFIMLLFKKLIFGG